MRPQRGMNIYRVHWHGSETSVTVRLLSQGPPGPVRLTFFAPDRNRWSAVVIADPVREIQPGAGQRFTPEIRVLPIVSPHAEVLSRERCGRGGA